MEGGSQTGATAGVGTPTASSDKSLSASCGSGCGAGASVSPATGVKTESIRVLVEVGKDPTKNEDEKQMLKTTYPVWKGEKHGKTAKLLFIFFV